jgi:signal transduction histidine kinase
MNLIEDQISRGSKLVSSIRKLSKVELIERKLEKVNISKTLKKAIKFTKESYPEKEIIIEESHQDEDYYTYGNQFLVDVFENILINAVKYNERNPVKININLSQINKNDKNFIKIEFQDNGWGISDSMKKILFKNPIKNKTVTKGMGLGLMLSKKILNIYNGEISVEDRIKGTPEQGSNFIINLPLIK